MASVTRLPGRFRPSKSIDAKEPQRLIELRTARHDETTLKVPGRTPGVCCITPLRCL
jgi:hypothetical protein